MSKQIQKLKGLVSEVEKTKPGEERNKIYGDMKILTTVHDREHKFLENLEVAIHAIDHTTKLSQKYTQLSEIFEKGMQNLKENIEFSTESFAKTYFEGSHFGGVKALTDYLVKMKSQLDDESQKMGVENSEDDRSQAEQAEHKLVIHKLELGLKMSKNEGDEDVLKRVAEILSKSDNHIINQMNS